LKNKEKISYYLADLSIITLILKNETSWFFCRLNDGHDVTVHLDTAIISLMLGNSIADVVHIKPLTSSLK